MKADIRDPYPKPPVSPLNAWQRTGDASGGRLVADASPDRNRLPSCEASARLLSIP